MVDEGENIVSDDEAKHIRINFGTLNTLHDNFDRLSDKYYTPKHVLWNKWYHFNVVVGKRSMTSSNRFENRYLSLENKSKLEVRNKIWLVQVHTL